MKSKQSRDFQSICFHQRSVPASPYCILASIAVFQLTTSYMTIRQKIQFPSPESRYFSGLIWQARAQYGHHIQHGNTQGIKACMVQLPARTLFPVICPRAIPIKHYRSLSVMILFTRPLIRGEEALPCNPCCRVPEWGKLSEVSSALNLKRGASWPIPQTSTSGGLSCSPFLKPQPQMGRSATLSTKLKLRSTALRPIPQTSASIEQLCAATLKLNPQNRNFPSTDAMMPHVDDATQVP